MTAFIKDPEAEEAATRGGTVMAPEKRVGSGRSQIQPVLVERQELVLGEGLSPTSGAGP
jgi:hypothetical protein